MALRVESMRIYVASATPVAYLPSREGVLCTVIKNNSAAGGEQFYLLGSFGQFGQGIQMEPQDTLTIPGAAGGAELYARSNGPQCDTRVIRWYDDGQ